MELFLLSITGAPLGLNRCLFMSTPGKSNAVPWKAVGLSPPLFQTGQLLGCLEKSQRPPGVMSTEQTITSSWSKLFSCTHLGNQSLFLGMGDGRGLQYPLWPNKEASMALLGLCSVGVGQHCQLLCGPKRRERC